MPAIRRILPMVRDASADKVCTYPAKMQIGITVFWMVLTGFSHALSLGEASQSTMTG